MGPGHRGEAESAHIDTYKVQNQYIRPMGSNFTETLGQDKDWLYWIPVMNVVRGAGESHTLPGMAELAAAVVYVF